VSKRRITRTVSASQLNPASVLCQAAARGESRFRPQRCLHVQSPLGTPLPARPGRGAAAGRGHGCRAGSEASALGCRRQAPVTGSTVIKSGLLLLGLASPRHNSGHSESKRSLKYLTHNEGIILLDYGRQQHYSTKSYKSSRKKVFLV